MLAPGITQSWPNQLKAIISLVVPFRESFLSAVRELVPIVVRLVNTRTKS